MVTIVNLSERPEAFPVIARWHWEEWGHADPDGSLESWTDRLSERNHSDRIPATFAALNDDDEPVGSVTLVDQDMRSHPELTPWLAGLFVLPTYRNLGLGSQLTLHATREAERFGATRLYLHTATATRLYEKLGWRRLFREAYEGEQVDVMVQDSEHWI